jgi:antitoxin ParD1/3/4
MKLVTVLLPEAYLEGLDELVRANMYPSRSSVIRSSVRDLLKKEIKLLLKPFYRLTK